LSGPIGLRDVRREYLRVTEIEREPTVVADGEAVLERSVCGDGQVLEPQEPVIH